MINKITVILLIISTLFLFLPIGLFAAERPVQFADARVMAMGNTFTAIADDKNILFFNPAGFATYRMRKTTIIERLRNPALWKKRYHNIGDLTLLSYSYRENGSGHLFDYKINPIYIAYKMDLLTVIKDELLNLDKESLNIPENILTDTIDLYTTAFNPSSSLELMSYVRPYFGFGLFSSRDGNFKMDLLSNYSPLPYGININAYADLIIPIGFGMPIPYYKRWAVGITVKSFYRLKLEINDFNELTEYHQWQQDHYNNEAIQKFMNRDIWSMLWENINYADEQNDQFKLGAGKGFDLGVMYQPSYSWKYGLQLSDVYTKIKWGDKTSSRIPFNARIGAAFMPGWNLWGLIENPILAIDIEDVLDKQKIHILKKIHFGTEIKILYRIISLRYGINEGYPSVGAGLDFSFYFLSNIPIFKWLRPDSVYFPVFNPNDNNFVKKNPLCCCLTTVLFPILYAHFKYDISYTGYKLGINPEKIVDYQVLHRFSFSYSY